MTGVPVTADAADASMTGVGFGWRAGALMFIVLSMVFVVAGLIATQVDDQ